MTPLPPVLTWPLFIVVGAAIFYIAAALFDLVSAHVLTERADHDDDTPDGLGSFADLLHDDYADAAEDDLTPLERHVADALRVASLELADDGCWPGDHDRGVHSPWHAADVVRIPRQRGAR